ncbi:hypothetical protein WJX82_008116 [Trebouxia sp. C0006]
MQKALIEQHFGEQVSNAPPQLLIHLAQRLKSLGNTAVRQKQFQEAVKCYSQAIAAAERDAVLYANRSAAYLALYQYQAALQDAAKAVQLHQSWPKGYYRLGMAHMAMGDWDTAAAVLSQGLHLDTNNDQMEAKLVESRRLLAEERQASLATSALLKRDLVLKLRQVRREEVRQQMLKQFKQSMAAPAWELEDYEWRATFLPAMKQKRLDKEKVLADPTARMLAEYVHALADLAQPKGCTPLLQDQSRLDAFQTAIESALHELPGGHVIVLGNGSNILGLMASQLGARRVTCIERGPMLYRVAKQTLQSNRHMKGTDSICLIDRQLQACGIKGGPTPTDIATADRQPTTETTCSALLQQQVDRIRQSAVMLPEPAEVLVTDLIDHSVLGKGLLPSLDYAAERLSIPGARVAPAAIQGHSVKVRVQQDSDQILFSSVPAQQRPRHAFIPRWHFDMVQDHMRNAAYDQAISRAVDFKKALGCDKVGVLDMGAGSGLLSMMAARAGAEWVVGAEVSQAMCDVGVQTLVMNGFGAKCIMVNKDVRHLETSAKPDGIPSDMHSKADVAIFEVFDSGLIGEGVLHMLAAAKQKLLTKDAILVPAAATVFCQPLQMRVGQVSGFNMEQVNSWQWRPDYEGMDLASCRESWTALGPAVQALAFDFYDAEANMKPSEVCMQLPIQHSGICNAIAFWFELDLDEQTQLSTSPYCEKGPTWQQAVQWMPEVEVHAGSQAGLLTKHDTYGISFAWSNPGDCTSVIHDSIDSDVTSTKACNSRSSGALIGQGGVLDSSRNHGCQQSDDVSSSSQTARVALKDPMWSQKHDELLKFNSQLAKCCTQNPLEYREVALAAVQFGSRPHDLGLDTDQAMELCTKMMG